MGEKKGIIFHTGGNGGDEQAISSSFFPQPVSKTLRKKILHHNELSQALLSDLTVLETRLANVFRTETYNLFTKEHITQEQQDKIFSQILPIFNERFN